MNRKTYVTKKAASMGIKRQTLQKINAPTYFDARHRSQWSGLIRRIEKAMGETVDGVQFGNILSRLRSLGAGALAAELRNEVDEWNGQVEAYRQGGPHPNDY